MTPEQFTYWLQGFNEIREKEAVGLTEKEWDIIKDHLRTVFHKVTPERTALKYIRSAESNDYGEAGNSSLDKENKYDGSEHIKHHTENRCVDWCPKCPTPLAKPLTGKE